MLLYLVYRCSLVVVQSQTLVLLTLLQLILQPLLIALLLTLLQLIALLLLLLILQLLLLLLQLLLNNLSKSKEFEAAFLIEENSFFFVPAPI